MRYDFHGSVTTVTEMAYSYADPKLKGRPGSPEGSTTFLPNFNGCLILPGRLYRGRIRHRNFSAINRRLVAIGKKLTMDDWNFLRLGGLLQGGDADYEVLLHRHMFETHPFVGLWGCMAPAAYHGKVQFEIGMADPSVKPVRMLGQRTDLPQRGEMTRDDISDPESFDAWAEKLGEARSTAKAKKERAKKRNAGEVTEEDDPETKFITSNLPFGRDMIPRGVKFEHHIAINRDPTELQLGQFLAAFEEFATDPFIGAQTGVNAGLVDVEYAVLENRKEIGSLKIDGRAGTLILSDKLPAILDHFWQEFPNMNFAVPSLPKKSKSK